MRKPSSFAGWLLLEGFLRRNPDRSACFSKPQKSGTVLDPESSPHDYEFEMDKKSERQDWRYCPRSILF
jgi:hypothetical protein